MQWYSEGRDLLRERAVLRDATRASSRCACSGVARPPSDTSSDDYRQDGEVTASVTPALHAPDVQEGPHRQPRRDRAAGHPRLPGARHRRRSRSTARPTASRCTSASPTTTSASARAPARESLPASIPRLIAAAEITGADAIHPGYGFLAENAEFAEICAASQHHVHRPHAASRSARWATRPPRARRWRQGRRADRAGHAGARRGRRRGARRSRAEIGFPVIIKAAAGGGGKGMRVARDAERVRAQRSSWRRTRRSSAFGNGDGLRREVPRSARATSRSRSSATRTATCIHLGERDCSVQRRHQKLIEEAPSPGADAGAARRGWATRPCARRAAIGYVGAGTIEFLLDEDGSFYFMEMNTRIQVEHPVTEMVTGVDLVKEQIRVAAGEPLQRHGDGRRCAATRSSAASTPRIPTRNFQPSPGHDRRRSIRRAARACASTRTSTPATRCRRTTTRCSPR